MELLNTEEPGLLLTPLPLTMLALCSGTRITGSSTLSHGRAHILTMMLQQHTGVVSKAYNSR